MSKICINSDCHKEIENNSVFCGYCGTAQETKAEAGDSANQGKAEQKPSNQAFYADDYEIVRQFDPVITPTKEKVSLENLFAIFQEIVQSKKYPFNIGIWEQRWRTEGENGKQRIAIQPAHDARWQKIIFPIAVEQLGNDTTIKLSVMRKNEIAEFYYSTLDSLGAFSNSSFLKSFVSPSEKMEDKTFELILEACQLNNIDLKKSYSFQQFKTIIRDVAEMLDESNENDVGFAKLISSRLGLNIEKAFRLGSIVMDLQSLYEKQSKQRFNQHQNFAAAYTATILSLGNRGEGISIAHHVNWQDEKKYKPEIDSAIKCFAEDVELILSNKEIAEITNDQTVSNLVKSFVDRAVDSFPDLKKHRQFLVDSNAKIDAIGAELSTTAEEPLSKIRKNQAELNERIVNARKESTTVDGFHVFAIAASLALLIILGASVSFNLGLILCAGVYVAYWVIRMILKSSLQLLEEQLKRASQEYSKIMIEVEKLRNQQQHYYTAIVKKKDELRNHIHNQMFQTFMLAEQNEAKFRTPSFVDEELEQLISVVRNLFNQVTTKLTSKQDTKDLKLQTTMGLGGMGFDE